MLRRTDRIGRCGAQVKVDRAMSCFELSLRVFISAYRILLVLVLLLHTSISLAANIFVTARTDTVGCDLIEAIESANTNSSIGGCAAGGEEQDTISFFAGFRSYELPSIAFSNLAGSSATPEITSDIRIVGPGAEPLVIARPLSQSDIYRAFTISDGGELTLENVSLQNFGQSSGFSGGAIFVRGSLTTNNVEMVDNSANFGGAIWVQRGTATIRNSLIRDNRAVQGGGGIGLSAFSEVNVYDSTISNNTSVFGAGVALAGSPDLSLGLYNTTITGNSATTWGGGVYLFFTETIESSPIVIRNTIVSGNDAAVSKEVHFINPSSATGLSFQNNVFGTSANTYLESVNSQSFLTDSNLVLTSDYLSIPLSSVLEPLKDNGGKTMTHALVANSPAIDAGVEFLVDGGPLFFFYFPGCRGERVLLGPGAFRPDQRGVARPVNNECDIGAYEYESLDDMCYVVKAKNNKVVTFCL